MKSLHVTDPSLAGKSFEYPKAASLAFGSERVCTDKWWLALFLACWVGMLLMLFGAVTSGDPARVWSGTDYLGNICGKHTGDKVPEKPYRPWEELNDLFLPVKVNFSTGGATTVSIGDALAVGVCVASCPQAGDEVLGYNGAVLHRSMFDHMLVMGRCIPIFDLYDMCEYNHCLSNATNDFNVVFDAGTFFFRGIAQVDSFKWVVILCLVFSLALTLVWLLMLRRGRVIRPFAYLSVAVLQVLLVTAAVLLWVYSDSMDNTTFSALYKVGATLVFVLSLCFFAFVLYIRMRFDSAVRVVQVASQTQIAMPSLSFISPLCLVLLIPFMLLAFMMATFIQTSGYAWETDDQALQNGTLHNSSLPDSDGDAAGGRNVFRPPWWKYPAHTFNLSMFLWVFLWMRHVTYLVITVGCSTWYFSAVTGETKVGPYGVLFRGFGKVMRYHAGTAALGSLVSCGAFVLSILLKPVEVGLDGLKACGWVSPSHTILRYSIWYVTELVGSKAYVMTGLTADPYVKGARRALFLVKSNIFHVGSIHFVSTCMMLFGKLALTGIVTFLGYLLLEFSDLSSYQQKSTEGGTTTAGVVSGGTAAPSAAATAANRPASTGLLVPLFVIGFFSWIVISVFSTGMQVCSDTLLLCFCYDIHVNDGSDDDPVYMPATLKKLMRKQFSWHLTHEENLLPQIDDVRGAQGARVNINANLAASEFYAIAPTQHHAACYDVDSDSSLGSWDACAQPIASVSFNDAESCGTVATAMQHPLLGGSHAASRHRGLPVVSSV
eukprot:Rhum_TRINITY_DN21435_c0_g1::Rhum_TRINITY_DN21435_c0_g1_i1::g.174062::m.174062/K15377/SLC44A2_4_5; solute carrier family 44 (choline transporter-like protein), member 2/4/5